MSDAFEALADIRRWACETLDASDAGRLCGMLSEVSRHANGLEDENEKLRELILDMLVDEERGHNDDDTYYEHVRLAKELRIEIDE